MWGQSNITKDRVNLRERWNKCSFRFPKFKKWKERWSIYGNSSVINFLRMKKKIRKDWLERPSSKSPYLQENSWKTKKERWNKHHKSSHEWSYKWLIPINRMRSHFYLETTKTDINIRFLDGDEENIRFFDCL